MSNEELVSTLKGHLEEDVPVPEFLCTEIESRDDAKALLGLLDTEDTQTASYAINLIGDNACAYDVYFNILTESRFDEEIRSDICDILRMHADEVKEHALTFYRQGVATGYMLEILSRIKARDEEVYQILIKAFWNADDSALLAGYLAAYGDEKALPDLLRRIENRSIGFVEFQELKYAIEALGGEYNEPRDFSADKDYLAVEAASIKAASEGGLQS